MEETHMKAKQILSLILALILTLSLVACGGTNDTPNSGDSTDPNAASGLTEKIELSFAHSQQASAPPAWPCRPLPTR